MVTVILAACSSGDSDRSERKDSYAVVDAESAAAWRDETQAALADALPLDATTAIALSQTLKANSDQNEFRFSVVGDELGLLYSGTVRIATTEGAAVETSTGAMIEWTASSLTVNGVEEPIGNGLRSEMIRIVSQLGSRTADNPVLVAQDGALELAIGTAGARTFAASGSGQLVLEVDAETFLTRRALLGIASTNFEPDGFETLVVELVPTS